MAKHYDLVSIGTGTAATVVALRARDAGWRVAMIDVRRFGGTCALRGCDPKKVLVEAVAGVDHARRMHGKGIAGTTHIDWQALMDFKRSFTDPVPDKKEKFYVDKGIDAFHGTAQFSGTNTLEVDGDTLDARHILIAAGAEAVALGIPGEEHLVTNELLLTLDALPPRVVIVGGGYIAAEFAHIAARVCTDVTVVHRGLHMLKQFSPETVGWLMASFAALGIDVHTGTQVRAVEKNGATYVVRALRGSKPLVFEGDLVVHAAGRAPDLGRLNLAAAGIALKDGRLDLNDYLQSVSNPAVYAAGDAAAMGPPLTPVATHDALVVAANILHGNHQKPDYRAVPSVAFTIPPIASVGIDEAEARARDIRFRMRSRDASDWFTARHGGHAVYGFKVLVEESTDRLLGAHLVGPHVDELINLFALAIRHQISATDLRSTIFAYPTAASDIGSMLP